MKSAPVAIAAIGLGLACVPAIAQNTPAEVQVQATRAVSKQVVGRTATGVPIVDLSLSYGVSLADLNLSTNSGATEGERRITAAAKAACKELSRQYPDATPDDASCAKAAADKAMPKLHELVVAAEKASSHG